MPSKSKSIGIPKELNGICLESERIQTIELRPYVNRRSKEAIVTSSMSLDLKVDSQQKTNQVFANATYTIKTLETIDDKSVVLLDCKVESLAVYVLPRENVTQREIMKYDWFFAYMSHSFIHRVLQETLINTDFQSMPIPFSIINKK